VGKQLIWFFISIIAFVVMFFTKKKFIYDNAYIFYLIGVALLALPFLIGIKVSETYRWVRLGPLSFQPSEFMKIFFVITVAKYLSGEKLDVNSPNAIFIPLIFTIIPFIVILNQPDLSTAVLFLITLLPMLYWAGVNIYNIFLLISPIISIIAAFNFYSFFVWVIILLIVLYLNSQRIWVSFLVGISNLSLGFFTPFIWDHLKPYQQKRIITMFNVWEDPQGVGYQVIQSQTAIGSGGLFGKGFGQGTQTHLKFLPQQHSDFVFSVVGEEYGFVGVVSVLILFFVLLVLLLNSAYKAKDRFSSLVIIGFQSFLFLHIFINVGVSAGLLPVTGLSLPFISYGGSFLLCCYVMLGIVINLSRKV